MREILLSISLFIMVVTSTFAQQLSNSGLRYHTIFEEQVIESYLQDKPIDILTLQFISTPHVSGQEVTSYAGIIDEFVMRLEEKRAKIKNEERFYEYFFYKVNQRFLKRYKPFASPARLLESGHYDCLSGTTLYALFLNKLGMDFEVVETTYHIYLKLNIGDKVCLIESTDPISGFITDEAEVEARLAEYIISTPGYLSSENKAIFEFEHDVDGAVDLKALAGLHYYNAAVNAYNNEEIEKSIDQLEKATLFYYSSRITELGSVINTTLLSLNDLDNDLKRDYLHRINKVMESGKIYAMR